jgi:hypothetical protein
MQGALTAQAFLERTGTKAAFAHLRHVELHPEPAEG